MRYLSSLALVALLTILSYCAAASVAHGQTAGDYYFLKWDGTKFVEVYRSPNSTDLIGYDGSGNLANIPRNTFAPLSHTQAWSTITATPTTLSGYGITDAITAAAVAAAYHPLNANTTGNAATATALQTARTINGVSFDGTANITVTAAAGTLTGSTLASGVTASSLTSLGTLSALNLSGVITGTLTGLGTTTSNGLALLNSTAAAAGAQQVSPALELGGNGWKTAATAASQSARMRLYTLPVQGSSAPTAELRVDAVINGVATNVFNIDSSGNITKIGGAFSMSNSGGSMTLAGGTYNIGQNFLTGAFMYPGNSTSGGSFTYGGAAGITDMRGYFAPTQAQLLQVQNTYTSATNYERAKVGWVSNAFVVGPEKGGSGGTARDMVIQTDGTTRITIQADGKIIFNSIQTTAGATGTLYNDGGVLKVSP